MSDNEVHDYGPRKAVVNASVDWPRLRLSEQVKHLRFFRDAENNIVVFAVMPFDSTQPGGDVLPIGKVGVADPIINASYARCFGLPCCGWPETTVGLVTHSTEMVQKGANLEAVRTPTVFIAGNANAIGNTVIWATGATERFRILKLKVFISGNATLAAAGAFSVNFFDGGTNLSTVLGVLNMYLANAAAPGAIIDFEFPMHQNGYTSLVIGNDLAITLSANLATGFVHWFIAGCLETF